MLVQLANFKTQIIDEAICLLLLGLEVADRRLDHVQALVPTLRVNDAGVLLQLRSRS